MTGIVLDTNVVSEQRRSLPDARVMAWFGLQEVDQLFLSATVVGELSLGAEVLPAGRRRAEMQAWLQALTGKRFANRILPYDAEAAMLYGELAARGRVRGRMPSISHVQIAAVAKLHDMAVATRNVADFELLGVPVVNPWDEA